MLNSCHGEIRDIPILFAHTGTKDDGGNRVYAVAVIVLQPGSPGKTFSSLIRYRFFTARDRYHSNLSRQELETAPEARAVIRDLHDFLGDAPFVLAWPQGDNLPDLKKLCGTKRIVDIGFALEFFLPALDSFSPKFLWEHLNRQPRQRISFTAVEAAKLVVDLIRHICSYQLNDKELPRAAALRYYLAKSDTLFGNVFLHLIHRLSGYFGDLFSIPRDDDTSNWLGFLKESKTKKGRAVAATTPHRRINIDSLDDIYKGIAREVRDFVYRPSQVAYARHVAEALNDAAVLTIEAGTGTGKTQGYLLPIFAFLDHNPEARAVISTYTKSLQNQILAREVAFLKRTIKSYGAITVTLLKGKSNYLCAWKLDHAYDDSWRGAELLAWLYCVNLIYHFRETDGDRIGERVHKVLDRGQFLTELHREVSAQSGCDASHVQCPAQIVTSEARTARLVITNHHKLALLGHDPAFSKLFKIFIIDEANHFEQACRNAYGLEINSRDIAGAVDHLRNALNKLKERSAGENARDVEGALKAIEDLMGEISQLGRALRMIKANNGASQGVQCLPPSDAAYQDGHIETHLKTMEEIILRLSEHLEWLKKDDKCRLLKIQSRTRERMKNARNVLNDQANSLKEMVTMVAAANRTAAFELFVKHWSLDSTPVDVSEHIRQNFYGDTKGLIYTAATICNAGSFDSFRPIVGLDRPFCLDEEHAVFRAFRFAEIASPFPPEVMEIIVHPEAVNGRYSNKQLWLAATVNILPELIQRNRGRTLVLFSSYGDLEAVTERLGDEIEAIGFPLLVQRRGASTADLCDEFREVTESVLFGVDTFWYGVDFKGDTLTQVIITRIPYASPSEPLQIARKRIMTPAEYNHRYRYEATIKMKQGIGRLIRGETDHGRVVILDSRWRKG